MTIPMDNTSDISSRERVQRLFDKNVDLETRRRKAAHNRIPSDPNAWQQMRENYEAIVLENHAFSEKHEVEYALWQLHYRRIEELRTHLSAALASAGSVPSQNVKGPPRPGPDRVKKIRAQFKTFLSEATGFYHEFMLKIRAKYGLPLGYFSDGQENQNMVEGGKFSTNVEKGLISCHRCLIYLGDLARYKGVYGEGESKARDFAAASSYYMQASSLLPSSGNPHHQLAILATYTGDEMVAIYRYFRSLAVDSPFSTARDNLTIAFEKNRQSYAQLFGNVKAAARVPPTQPPGKGRGKSETRATKDNKVEDTLVKRSASGGGSIETSKSFRICFIRLNGLLFTRTSLETFEEVLSIVKSDLLKLLASGPDEEYNVGSDGAECRLFIVRLVAILIFTVHNVKRETENQSYAEILQRSVLLKNAFTALFEFMGHILERCTKLNDPSKSYLLPGIMVFVEWLACQQGIAVGTEVEEKQADARSFFWNRCVSFLNKLLSSGLPTRVEDDEISFFNTRTYDEGEAAYRFALFEDFELRGFLPLVPAQLILDFSTKSSRVSDVGNKGQAARLQRIIAAGKALANMIPSGQQGVYFNSKLNKFCIGLEPQQTDDDLSISNSLETHGFSGAAEENQANGQIDPLQPELLAYTEEEEEDEVILFRPTMHANESASKLTSSEVLASNVTSSVVGFGGNAASVPPSNDAHTLQHAVGKNSRPPPTSFSNIPGQYLPQMPSSTSVSLVEQQLPIADELRNLRLQQNGSPMKYGVQDQYAALLPAAFSVPFPNHSVNHKPGNNYQFQVADNVVAPPVFSSVMPPEYAMDSLSMKTSAMMPTAARKNPVSRPVRHTGPPPGFNSIPQRSVEEPFSGGILNNGGARMDDYSWLDGFQFPPSSQGMGFNRSVNPTAQPHHPSMGTMNFPFPGKQVSTLQIQPEMQNLQNYGFSGSMQFHHHHQQQFEEGNQQSIALPEQLQGDQLYQDRFIV